jgi:hypothetical protein
MSRSIRTIGIVPIPEIGTVPKHPNETPTTRQEYMAHLTHIGRNFTQALLHSSEEKATKRKNDISEAECSSTDLHGHKCYVTREVLPTQEGDLSLQQ